MNRALVITVAGTSSRFRKSLGKDVLKAIYTENNEKSILDILLEYAQNLFSNIIIVGGYKYEELSEYIKKQNNDKIKLVYNKNYERGSNESLLCGIRALEDQYDEIVFAEGDLIIDKDSFFQIVNSSKNVITYNNQLIQAKCSVAYYFNTQKQLKYIYDTKHQEFMIDEPFISIANSGQIWKFKDINLLRKIERSFDESDLDKTNLATIEPYFNATSFEEIQQVQIAKWFNCNTVDDYRKAINIDKG